MSDFLLLSELSLDPLRDDTGVSLAMMGLLVVSAAFVLFRIFMDRMPRLAAVAQTNIRKGERASASSAVFTFAASSSPATATAGDKQAAAPSEPPPEHVLAIIAAVVADMVGKRHRILRTREIGPDNLVWSMHGRLQNHISYRMKPKNRGN